METKLRPGCHLRSNLRAVEVGGKACHLDILAKPIKFARKLLLQLLRIQLMNMRSIWWRWNDSFITMILHVKSEFAIAREKLSQLCEPENVFARRWVEGGCKSAIRVHPVCRRLRRRQVGQVGGEGEEQQKETDCDSYFTTLTPKSSVTVPDVSTRPVESICIKPSGTKCNFNSISAEKSWPNKA